MDQYLRFVNGIQALRRRVSALDISLGGALGVAADPFPIGNQESRAGLGASQAITTRCWSRRTLAGSGGGFGKIAGDGPPELFRSDQFPSVSC